MNYLPPIKERYLVGNNYKISGRRGGRGSSRIEKICNLLFSELFGDKFIRVRPKWLINPKTGKTLELDGYCRRRKIAFEYQGIQHYIWPNYLRQNKKQFEAGLGRDQVKRDLCQAREVVLLEIPFVIAHDQILSYIKHLLRRRKVEIPNKYYQYIWPNLSPNKFSSISDKLLYLVGKYEYIQRKSTFYWNGFKLYLVYNSIININNLERHIRKLLRCKQISIIHVAEQTHLFIWIYSYDSITDYKYLDYSGKRSYLLNISTKNKIWGELSTIHYLWSKIK